MPALSRMIAAILAGAALDVAAAQTSSFTGLTLPSGPDARVASVRGVSADGSVVVGGAAHRAGTQYRYSAMRWRHGLGFDEPVPSGKDQVLTATGVSADGRVIVGNASSELESSAWIVRDTTVTRLQGKSLWAVSADGCTGVGWSIAGSTPDAIDRAGVFNIASGVWTPFEATAAGFQSRATGVSNDAAVIVAEAGPLSAALNEALVRLGPTVIHLPRRAGVLAASTVSVSASGTMIAGSNLREVADPRDGIVFQRSAWAWTQDAGEIEISSDLEVHAVSPDGRIVVGSRVDDEYGMPERAFLWDVVRGSVEVRVLLEQVGLAQDLVGWTLLTADAISQSGTVYAVAGRGFDPHGNNAGWVATFETPPTARFISEHVAATRSDPSVEAPAAAHVDQRLLASMVQQGKEEGARRLAFDIGDLLFNTTLNDMDGVGAHVGNGLRFTRTPRPDLDGPGQWARHIPPRQTGPSAASCNACHGRPFDDGGGRAEVNIVSDPHGTGQAGSMIQRNTPHLFGAGAVQRLAEEMTDELRRTADEARDAACRTGAAVTRDLVSKGVSFGRVVATPEGGAPCRASLDTSGVVGVDADLVVRPFQWKGSETTLRRFARDAAHRELGMQAVELVGAGVDGDFDGVVDELSVGDITALVVYLAGQPRPTTRTELAALQMIDPVPSAQVAAIERGRVTFDAAGCASCHTPSMTLDDPVFFEPSRSALYRDRLFPAGQDPVAMGLTTERAVRFDLTCDHTDNRVIDSNEQYPYRLGSFVRGDDGRAVIELFGDLKRHDMGPGLAESIDEFGTGRSVFLTRNLWGVGSTAPYLHDGRATTLLEAISAHGGEARASRDRFMALHSADKNDVLEFLNNLVVFKAEVPGR